MSDGVGMRSLADIFAIFDTGICGRRDGFLAMTIASTICSLFWHLASNELLPEKVGEAEVKAEVDLTLTATVAHASFDLQQRQNSQRARDIALASRAPTPSPQPTALFLSTSRLSHLPNPPRCFLHASAFCNGLLII